MRSKPVRPSRPAVIPAVILAAGKGTRMKAPEPKAAVQVGGRPMVARVVSAMRDGGATRVLVVVGHRAADVQAALGPHVEYVVQEEQLGTGHAVRCTEPYLAGHVGPVLVAYSDIPLLRKRDIAGLIRHHLRTGAAATLLTAVFDEPGMLGRIVRAPDGSVARIVEARDATPEELAIREINVGVYGFQAPLLFEALAQVTNDNAQGQYYLTDTIRILVSRGHRVEAVAMEVSHTGMGVDTVEDLARAQRLWAVDEAVR